MPDSRMANPGPLGVYSDAARRAADVINTHLLADPEGTRWHWVAIRLSDGGSDGVVYECKCAATEHQLHETQCMYVQIHPDGVTPKETEILLNMHRGMYLSSFKMPDPPCMRHNPLGFPR